MNRDKPKIRFKGFEEAWSQKTLGEICDLISRTSLFSDAPIMMISANKGFINQNERYSYFNAGQSLKKYTLLQKNEFAYNHGASKIRPFGSCFTLNIPEARVPFVYHCFRITETTNHKFLELQLNGHRVEKQLKRLISSSARLDGLLNISFDDYTSVSFLSPNHNEQEKIGKLFERIDHLLNLQQRKCDKLKDIKKSMLTKMFPKPEKKVPEVRFEGFTDDWVECKLGEIAEINPTSILPFSFKYVDLESVYGTRMTACKDETIETAPSRAQRFAKKGDIFYQMVRPYQKNNYLFELSGNYVFSTGYAQLRPIIDSYFIMSALQTDRFVNKVMIRCTGTSYPAINSKSLGQIDFYVPRNDYECNKIGKLFEHLDHLISLNDLKLSKLRLLKHSLLEGMFV